MNVLLISPHYAPSTGGVETQVQLLANGLVKKGHSVTVITSGKIGSTVEGGVSVIRHPLPETRLDYLNGCLFISHWYIRRVIANQKYDIIHIH